MFKIVLKKRFALSVITLFVLVYFLNNNCSIYAASDGINNTNITADKIEINPITKKSYFVSHDHNKIYVVNENTKKINTVINTSEGIEDLAINNKTNLIYVGFKNETGKGFYVINGNTDKIYDTINANWTSDFKLDPTQNMMYILDNTHNGDRLYELNLKTKKEERSISLEEDFFRLEVNPFKELAYVVKSDDNIVNVINTSSSLNNLKSIKNITVAADPYSTAINHVTNKIYIINEGISRISVIDSSNKNTLKNLILNSSAIAEEPKIAVDPKTDFIFVANPKEGKILVVDDKTGKVLTTLDSGIYPTSLTLNSIDGTLYVTSLSGPIKILNVTKDSIIKHLGKSKLNEKLGIIFDEAPTKMAIHPITNKIYVIYDSQNKISVIDGTKNKIIDIIDLNFVPSDISINPKTNRLFAISNTTLYVIDTSNDIIIHNFSISSSHSSLSGIAIDTKNNQIYLHGETLKGQNIEYQIDATTYRQIRSFKSSSYLNPDPLIYVISKGEDTLVVNGNNNDNITIPTHIKDLEYNPITDLVYALSDDFFYVVDFETRSVSSIKTNSIFMSDLALNPNSNLIYLSDSLRNIVQVIDGTGNKIIANIHVGISPSQMKINFQTNTIYVINEDSNTVSVIDGYSKKVLVPSITFNIDPPNAGYIKCKTEYIATNKYIRIGYNTPCTALPNKGFEFSNWVERLDKNSTRTISTISKDNYWYTPFWNWIKSAENNFGFETPNYDAATFTISRTGNFTANFEKMPPPIQPEYWIPLYGVIVSTIVGWSIPSIIGWTRSRRQHLRLRQYRKRIEALGSSKLDNKGKQETPDNLMRDITIAHSKAKINELQYEILKKEILQYHQGIISKTINSVRDTSIQNNQQHLQALDDARKQLTDAYSEGKISNEQYTNLKNEISVLYHELYRKRIDSLNGRQDIDGGRVLHQIEYEIEDAFARGKINDQHYDLLNKKIASL